MNDPPLHDEAPKPTPVAVPVGRAVATAVALGGLLLVSFVLEARVWMNTPAAEDYRAAAEAVRAGFKSDDVLVLAPAFALRPLEQLGDLRGMGLSAAEKGMALGASVLWVVAGPGADEALANVGKHYKLEGETRHGALRVLRYRVAQAAAWHGATALATAEVRLFKRDSGPDGVMCNLQHPRLVGWTCPGEPDWQRTTVEWADAGGHHSGGERGIWMHPPPRGDRKSVTWRGATLEGTLVVGATHTEHGARNARGPVHVAIDVDGRPIFQESFPKHHGWLVHRVPVPAELSGAHDVTISVTSDDNAAAHLLVDVGVAQ